MSEQLIPLKWSTQERRVRDLVPMDYNPRILTEEGRQRLTNSILKFNLAEIPAINADNLVLAGHQRLAVLVDLGRGDERIDVRVPNRLLTKAEVDEYNVTSNVGAGQWDYQSLLDNFSHLNLASIMDATSLEALAALSAVTLPPAEEQEFDPVLPRMPVTVLGDVYEFRSHGRDLAHRLVCGSSTEADVLQALLQGRGIRLTLTDPPYNINYEGGTKEALTILNDNMDSAAFRAFLYDFYSNAYAHMEPGAPLYVFHADSEGASFRDMLQQAGLKLSQCLIWVKQAFVLSRQDFHWQHEPILYGYKDEGPHPWFSELQEYVEQHTPILYGWKEGAAHPWYADRKQTTVLKFDRPTRNAEHPTMKPLDILEYLLDCSSKQDDVVFDGFGGSGSLLIACEKTQRSCHAVELDPRFCDVHVRRFAQFMRDNQRAFSIFRNGVELTAAQLDEYVHAAAA
ncbi:DNA modification methylase [Hymenobacter chitinivorans]|uniref:site-specific DNA-methyltransferase (adenine-specific) n=1 Tax=Hymenobacter chitinivorans DSM 11115 TaxID=1121954 RepID=A0A2M9BNB5_9BACT|nr:DNA methyltransferase [Hymenobacter chitinivorans]PJJ59435.1 DNA modification methylase [Hymenobacter chitinivorans DSM 11115]